MTVPPQIEPAPDGGGLARSKASTRDLLPKADAPTGGNQRQVTLRYIDRPDCAETFADSIAHLSFDGQSLRIEFAVTRMDDAKPDTPMTGRRYPACRLVLPSGAAVELINRRSAPR